MESSQNNHFELSLGNLWIRVQSGQLTGFRNAGVEFMHTANQPGWGNSDTEMFPVIGPMAQLNYTLEFPEGSAVLDQHGLLRELDYELVRISDTELVLEKRYRAGTPVLNSKYPNRSPQEWLSWPFTFSFQKHFKLVPGKLEIVFKISGDPGMPYMLGYHPAFNLQSSNAKVRILDRDIGIQNILQVGDRALEVAECNSLVLEDEYSLAIRTHGFGNFMLWSPDAGMLCIEPITFYPYKNPKGELSSGFMKLTGNTAQFSVSLEPMH